MDRACRQSSHGTLAASAAELTCVAFERGVALRACARLLRLQILELLLALEVADAARDPRRGRFVLQIVPEPLDDPPVVIELVRLLPKAVILAGIREQHDVLLRAPRDVVQLDALVPE